MRGTACPRLEVFEPFLLGRLSDVDALELEQHLAECGPCVGKLQSLNIHDPLADAVTAVAHQACSALDQTEVALIADLIRLPFYQETDASGESRTHSSDFLDAPQGADEIGRIEGYRFLRVLGAGGMGTVYLAEQLCPRRLVAVKVLAAGAAANQDRQARFRAETEMVARLQHPHIVPLYEVGKYEGRPFFAMEYLGGGSLAGRLAATPFAPRAAAEIVVAVARAIHFAHEHGVVHRDLKPSNVLLTEEGIPKVGDFGLAKQLDSGHEEAGYQTASGAILGTPNYMAPEQAGGGDVGPATDVYALGAILYEMLTGRPPFRAATVLQTLNQVRTEEPVPPSRLHPGLPRDLQTICLKCMEKKPERRFSNAQALADDLNRFLRGEAIQARPVSRTERLQKWVRRQPALAGLLVVSSLSLVGLLLGLWLHTASLRGEVLRAESQEREAREQRERADASYAQARQAINRMLARLKDQRLTDVPQAAKLRHDLQEEALTFFQNLPKEEDIPDPAIRLEVARAYRQIGFLQMTAGRIHEAAVNYEHARGLLDNLVLNHPENLEFRVELAGVCDESSSASRSLGRHDEAIDWVRKALALRIELVRLHPERAAWQADLAGSYHQMGFAHLGKGMTDVVKANWVLELPLWEKLVRDYPRTVAYQVGLANACSNLGLFAVGEDIRIAEGYLQRAESLVTNLTRDHPDEILYLAMLGDIEDNWGNLKDKIGDPSAAADHYTQAVRVLETALQLEPRFPRARNTLACALSGRALAYRAMKRDAEAVRDWGRVVQLISTHEATATADPYCGRAALQARSGAHALAAAVAQALTARSGLEPDDLYRFAVVWSLCSAAAATDTSLIKSEQEKLVEQYGSSGIALLQQLKGAGYFQDTGHARKLHTDVDLQPLHDRTDFQQLLKEVEQNNKG